MASPRWILDGAPYYADELVYRTADTVIFLDYATPAGKPGQALSGSCSMGTKIGRLRSRPGRTAGARPA